MMRGRALSHFPLAMLAGLACLLAACGEPQREEGGLFLREAPDGPFPIRPAPNLEDIRPVPDLDADRKALAMICAGRGISDPQSCACIASAATREFRGRALAYFVAVMIGDQGEARRLQEGWTEEMRQERAFTAGRIALECGAQRFQ